MLALIDTGASRSLIRHDVAVEMMRRMKRTTEFQPTNCVLKSVTGHGIDIEGMTDILIPRVGLVTFQVIRDMAPQCLIGIDQLYRHDFTLTERGLQWGEAVFGLASTPQAGGAYLALTAVQPTDPQTLPPGEAAIKTPVSLDGFITTPAVPAVTSSPTKDSQYSIAQGADTKDQ